MVGAKLVFYATGTSTLKTIYSEAGLSVPLANPVTAVSSGAGAIYPDIYLDGIYKVVQQDDSGTAGVADGVVLWTRDPVGDVATGNFEAWLNDSTYNIPEVVYASDDNYYISLVDANQGNEPSASPVQWQLIPVKDMVGLDETQTLTNKTLTAPVINDSSGNELLILTEVASAVNEPTITNAAAGNRPSINQTGANDVGLDIEGVVLHNGVITGTLDTTSIGASIANQTYGGIGTYAFLGTINETDYVPGDTSLGSNLIYAAVHRYSATQSTARWNSDITTSEGSGNGIGHAPEVVPASPSGTWQCHGNARYRLAGLTYYYPATLWLRIS